MSEETKESGAVFVVKRLHPQEIVHSESFVPEKAIKRPSKSYQTTSDEQRFKFVQKILKKELTIREAATAFGIRYSTAKTIMKVYKSEGRFEKKKHRLKKGHNKLEKVHEEEQPVVSQAFMTPPSANYLVSCEDKSMYNRGMEVGLPEGFWAFHIAAHMK